jgi:hypothetical protein
VCTDEQGQGKEHGEAYGAAGFGPAYFVVERKDGLIYEYGNTTDSRIEIGGISTARVWALNKIRDGAGNSVLFNYTEDLGNGSYRIDTIQYTSNASQGIGAPYQVKFVYESLPLNEVDVSFMAGTVIRCVREPGAHHLRFASAI